MRLRHHNLERSGGERARSSSGEQRPDLTFGSVEEVARFLRSADRAASAPLRCLAPAETSELIEQAIVLLGEEGARTAQLERVFRIGRTRLRGSLRLLQAKGRIYRSVEQRHDRTGVLQPQIVWRAARFRSID
jgi:hypothetical protein